MPKDFRDVHANIEWKDIIGLRNVIVHEYASVDLEIVWDVVQNDLPVLKGQLEKI